VPYALVRKQEDTEHKANMQRYIMMTFVIS